MKILKSLTGAKELSLKEQKALLGGKQRCSSYEPCTPPQTCIYLSSNSIVGYCGFVTD